MADKYSGTILPQSPDTLENQKAILDLLKKINEVAATADSATAGDFSLLVQGNITSNLTLALQKPTSGLHTYYITVEAYTTNNSSVILSAGSSVTQTILLPATAGHLFFTAYIDKQGYVYLPASRYV